MQVYYITKNDIMNIKNRSKTSHNKINWQSKNASLYKIDNLNNTKTDKYLIIIMIYYFDFYY